MTMAQHALLDNKTVRLVGTKADLTITDDGLEEALAALDYLAADLNRRAAGRASVTPLLISSRPRPGTTQIGEGFEELIGDILADKESPEFSAGASWPESLTELDALMHPYRSNLQ